MNVAWYSTAVYRRLGSYTVPLKCFSRLELAAQVLVWMCGWLEDVRCLMLDAVILHMQYKMYLFPAFQVFAASPTNDWLSEGFSIRRPYSSVNISKLALAFVGVRNADEQMMTRVELNFAGNSLSRVGTTHTRVHAPGIILFPCCRSFLLLASFTNQTYYPPASSIEDSTSNCSSNRFRFH